MIPIAILPAAYGAMFGLERSLGTRLVPYADDLVILCRRGKAEAARRRYEHDIGAALALEFLSYHVEASYLKGEDATFVCDLTSHYISEAGDAARRMAGEPRRDEGAPGSSGF